MNYKTIEDKIVKAGFYNYKRGFDEGGPKIGIRVGKKSVWGYLPIDDESDEEFADFMIGEANKLKGNNGV